jgi:hypothetical protein
MITSVVAIHVLLVHELSDRRMQKKKVLFFTQLTVIDQDGCREQGFMPT